MWPNQLTERLNRVELTSVGRTLHNARRDRNPQPERMIPMKDQERLTRHGPDPQDDTDTDKIGAQHRLRLWRHDRWGQTRT